MKKISPISNDTVIEEMTTDTFVLSSFKTLTGFTFFVTASLGSKHLREFLENIYSAYADYILKNPFYTMNQSVNKQISELFEKEIERHVREHDAKKRRHHGYRY